MDNTKDSTRRQGPSMLDIAIEYAGRGWSIIPIAQGTKKPPKYTRWRPCQTERPTEDKLREWFESRHDLGLAVILGKVSGGLVCRDFDDKPSYRRWRRAHPDLAADLPTVETADGYHVYFRAGPAHLIFRDLRPAEEGEYRGDSGHYCLLPPSRHPDGPEYKWLIPLPAEVPFVADVAAAGLLLGVDVTQKAQEVSRKSQVSGGDKTPVRENGFRLTSSQKDFIEEAMARSLPTKHRERRTKLMQIARQIKFAPEFADIPATKIEFLKPYLRRWWKVAKPKTSGKHPYFPTTWQDFVFAWEEARIPYGETMKAIFEKAHSTPPPKLAVEKYGRGSARALLASFCRELQQFNGSGSFFLSGRTTEPYFPVSAMQIWRWLNRLTQDGILRVVKKYPKGTRLATEYRYLPED